MASGRSLERWKEEMPTEAEMRPKDKYTMFDRKEKNYRKGVHSELSAPTCWDTLVWGLGWLLNGCCWQSCRSGRESVKG